MYIIGLTGTTGSGKGYVSKMINSLGIVTIDTDALTHELYNKGECANEVERAFPGVLNELGAVNREKLGNIVFANKEKMLSLQNIVYAYISKKCDEITDAARARGDIAAVIDAPMLFESGFDKKCDYIITVSASPSVRLERIMKRDGITAEKAQNRMANQKSDDYYIGHSDFVIYNNGQCDVESQLKSIFVKIGIIGA